MLYKIRTCLKFLGLKDMSIGIPGSQVSLKQACTLYLVSGISPKSDLTRCNSPYSEILRSCILWKTSSGYFSLLNIPLQYLPSGPTINFVI